MQCEQAVLLCGAATMYPAQHQVSLMLYCARCITYYSTHRQWAQLQTLTDAGLWRLH